MGRVRELLGQDDEDARALLDAAFERFEEQQGPLSAHVASILSRPLDETALALGYFLTLAVWVAFENAHGGHLEEVGEAEVRATDELLALDEELRRTDPAETLDSDDVVAMEQPELLAFIHEHIDFTLEAHADEVDVDDVHSIYRLVLIEVLALSYGVRRPAGYPLSKTEMTA